jgi:hypothetical protein
MLKRKVTPEVQSMRTIEVPINTDLSLVRDFIAPWMTDFSEVDGSRSYAVYHKREEIIGQRIATKEDINASCTVACKIVSLLFSSGVENR